MIAAYLFSNYNCILACEVSFLDQPGHSKLTTSECWLKVLFCVAFITEICHYGKVAALHKFISIVLQLKNQMLLVPNNIFALWLVLTCSFANFVIELESDS